MSKAQKEYIVTLKDYNLLEGFYNDMESGYSFLTSIPERSVECLYRRPLSRNTHYLLTDEEARKLSKDPRVESVTIKIKNLSIKTKLHSTQTGIWNRGPNAAVNQKNWGLYRCQLDQNIPLWGSESSNNEEISTIKINATGKNVDVIVVDETLFPSHSEFTGRVVEYDWFGQHDVAVKGQGTVVTTVARAANIATVTTASPHGLTAGNFVNVVCNSDATFSTTSATNVISVPSSTTFSYANTGSSVFDQSAIGICIGEYQYTTFSNFNNHATHVAATIAGETQGWARGANIYNLRHEAAANLDAARDAYYLSDFIIDYVRQFHATKAVNPETGRKNPTLVNNSWGFGADVYALLNQYTGYANPRFSKVYYRNQFVQAAGSPVDTGLSGVYTAQALVAGLVNIAPGSGNRIVTTGNTEGTVNSLSFVEVGSEIMDDVGEPAYSAPDGIDSRDDAYWIIATPFPISYLATTRNEVFVCSNSYVTFGVGDTDYDVGPQGPQKQKILVSGGDRSCERILTTTIGTTGTRKFVIRWEGYDGSYGGAYEPSPNTIWEMTFYEATPNQIDLHIISNASYRAEFTTSELADYGLNLQGPAAPHRNVPMDADIADAISEGIIFVGSAGNSSTKIDTLGGLDYNNYFVDNGLPIYYHRGSSPGATTGVICVGESSGVSNETKSQESNTGPRVDLYAPGTNIISAVYDELSTGTNVVNDGSTLATLSTVSSVSGLVTATTTAPHGFTNGTVVTIQCTSNLNYSASSVAITYVDPSTFTYTITIPLTETTTSASGTIWTGFLYQKSSGTSSSTAQVTGLLALALEQYPNMTQADAREYILNYAKENVMEDTAGGYTDTTSLQNGNNKFAFYYKERADAGVLVPKSKQWVRPSSGLVFPRPPIRKK